MANYIIGDIQGCVAELHQLLKLADFTPEQDTLWLAGDLVARGPNSLETLRFIQGLGDSAKAVLGNHDLHLLAVAQGIHPVKSKDKTLAIFEADDADELLDWVRHLPLLVEHPEFVVTHAGISPQWDLATARASAQEVEQLLRSPKFPWLLANMYANTPDLWDTNLQGIERYRYIINTFTRMRFCFSDGRLDMACKLPPAQVPTENLMPWFALPQRIQLEKTVLFGHWAALEGYADEQVIGLDTGCVWGGPLTMLRWEDKQYFQQPALGKKF
ncbi:bis(5'-nucleosyl)-tetraphosphatase (symmetrical) [Vibrio sp. V27_P1S3P104]|uniref:bis(5'-nucleosyl)-tetraphosphatase (symmetrical) ApaH n=1 Tax=unclassified Vibrio TaxID=2614977 RepID=UPI0013726DBF|nr:bis(5'-nucleosyl)-tetraphosphatase (symmetrical) [Vibrio sp. V28_P6S34P95]NAX03756.1 bis(5'-nucleosyl)-tetraphosphatase (symmetrical) [Vibrio sp. V30_P3S12P165]NAX33668.1 bis(5'-nucleosyl)-tetraphosphatase (symmetrical) [Vibrio sp. V29_P1S30P107]NAX37429.1 bis(5'-nucleosyl)-tetraphosphatase (symmetrical) [Vibrio sp. V27_P1S3P104]NAX39495.1 bis(5'-nucleosyl)-tetraphosphatase (symmetrical) [Vibrio sp. V26_P1S5P106]NNN44585.1 bis(5'-nucleosyl)-tetraphosphatase (symmetrical) [Vibrio sp. 1-1(7)]